MTYRQKGLFYIVRFWPLVAILATIFFTGWQARGTLSADIKAEVEAAEKRMQNRMDSRMDDMAENLRDIRNYLLLGRSMKVKQKSGNDHSE